MKFARFMIAAAAALAIASAAFAQQAQTGTVTRLDRINNTIAIQQLPDGTTGAGGGGAAEMFKARDGAMLDTVHAGDRVSYSVTDNNGTRTITRIEKK